jgi:repressor LexA
MPAQEETVMPKSTPKAPQKPRAEKPLSKRQEAILVFIQRFTNDNGYPPAIREIGHAVGISSTSVVNYNLTKLEKRGYLTRAREVSRGLRLSRPVGGSAGRAARGASNVLRIPLLGTIAAGAPIGVPDVAAGVGVFGAEEAIELGRDFLSDDAGLFALKVKGDSMIDALINDGDIVVMRQSDAASNGEMVAVWIKDRGETTLKRFFHEGRRVRLQPANPTMDPIYVEADNVQVQGRVLMVVRQI